MMNMATCEMVTEWTECEKRYLLSQEESWPIDLCLRNRPHFQTGLEKIFRAGEKKCGNGVFEEGEECDCGLADLCDNLCCNPLDCKLRSNATCSVGACCELRTCQVEL